MDIQKHWKIILSLTLIFVAGAVTGSVITFQVVKRMVRNRTNPDQWSARVLREYRSRLHLTPEQIERIRPRMIEANRNLKAARAEFAQTHSMILRDIQSDLMRELTPEQREIFKQIREEQTQRFRRAANPGAPGSNQLHTRPPWQQRPKWQRDLMKREMTRRERERRGHPPSTNSPPRQLNQPPPSKIADPR